MDTAIDTTTINKTSLFDFGNNLKQAWHFSELLSRSGIVPDAFRDNPASCLIALDMAARMRRNPLEIMQALNIIKGKPSFAATFLISLINSSDNFEPLRFRFYGEGDARSCIAWTVDKRTGDKLEGPPVSIQMAKEEGWYARANSKWPTMPDLMLQYRAAAFFSRVFCPDLTGGFHATEELQEMEHKAATDIRPKLDELEAQIKADM